MHAKNLSTLLLSAAMLLGWTFLSAQTLEPEKLTPSEVIHGESFGYAVAMDESNLIVSTHFTQTLYFYTYDGATWQPHSRLSGTEAPLNRNSAKGLGAILRLDGSTLAVGAPQGALDQDKKVGLVAIYAQREGNWAREALLRAPTPTKGAQFGAAMALDRDRLIVSAPGYEYETGQAWVYTRVGNNWEASPLPDPQAKATFRFGESVALSDDWAAVGAPGTAERRRNPGACYLYRHTPQSGWTLMQTIDDSRVEAMGQAVAMQNNRLVVSAYDQVRIYDRTDAEWLLTATLDNPDAGDAMSFGRSLTLSPDGQMLLVGSSGTAYLYTATEAGWQISARLRSDATGFASDHTLNSHSVLVNSPYEGEEYIDGAVYLYPLAPMMPALIE